MRYCWLAITISLCLPLVGCSQADPERLVLTHPDEMVRTDHVIVLADRREFAVMAFINAIGYDEELAPQMHPIRVRVRALVQAKLASHPEKLRAWQDWYKRRQIDPFIYQSYALSLNMDYPFRQISPFRSGPVARAISDLPDQLNDFWITADLESIWQQVKDDYMQEVRRYDPAKIEKDIAFVWEYLRMPRPQTREIQVCIPNPLFCHYHAQAGQFGPLRYEINDPGSRPTGLNVHEYLHQVVDPLVTAQYKTHQAKLDVYFHAGQGKPYMKWYQSPDCFTAESLVRALDHRITILLADGEPATRKQAEQSVSWETI